MIENSSAFDLEYSRGSMRTQWLLKRYEEVLNSEGREVQEGGQGL